MALVTKLNEGFTRLAQLVKGKQDKLSFTETKASGGRPLGTPFVLSSTRPAIATYTFDVSISNTGGYVEIVISADGPIAKSKTTLPFSSSATGTSQMYVPITVFVPAGAQVVIATTASSGNVSVHRRQEVIF